MWSKNFWRLCFTISYFISWIKNEEQEKQSDGKSFFFEKVKWNKNGEKCFI